MTEDTDEGFQPKVVKIEDESEIPMREGVIVFGAGQFDFIKKDYPHFFDNSFSTVHTKDTPKGAHNYGSVDLRQLAETEMVHNSNFMHTLLENSARQMNGEVTAVATLKSMAEFGDREKENYRLAREKFLNQAHALGDFLGKLDELGVQVPESKDVEEIKSDIAWEAKFPAVS